MSSPSKPDNEDEPQPKTGLDGLIRSIREVETKTPSHQNRPGSEEVADHQNAAPVDKWDPSFCGDLDMIIRTDGRWDYNNTPIGREKLVRLFATVLKREGEDYYLVTPAEKIRIKVEDAPFLAVAIERRGSGREQRLQFTTNVGDIITAGPGHELRFEKEDADKLIPYIHIRGGLEAHLSRPVYYELANYAEQETSAANAAFGIWSRGEFFPMETAETMVRENQEG